MNDAMLIETVQALTEGVPNPLTNLANTAALLWETLDDINWAGFYLLDRGALWLGPFAGKPACTRIEIGKGVCGTALAENATQRVPDVHAFPGHIACDAASRSELVVPIRYQGRPIGVLDIDSPSLDRFSEGDARLMERFCAVLEANCDFSHLQYDLT